MSESGTSKVARKRRPSESASTAAGIAAERMALAGRGDRERQVTYARIAAGRRDERIAESKP